MTFLESAPASVIVPPQPAVPQAFLQDRPLTELGSALEQLPPEQRLVLTLLHFEELDAFETALVLDLSIADVLQLRAQAMQHLGTCLCDTPRDAM